MNEPMTLENDLPPKVERTDEEVWADLVNSGTLREMIDKQAKLDPECVRSLFPPGSAIEVPWWRRELGGFFLRDNGPLFFPALLIALLAIVALCLYGVIVRGEERRTQARMEKHLTATVDLCAVKLSITQGRLLKTQGEVLHWRETKDGGVDLYLVKEIDDRLSCGMKAHLPPTIPETTWRPVSGERVTLCGLMLPAEHQARMGAAWRCM